MKAYLTNGVIIEGSVEEIREYLGDQVKENQQPIISIPYIYNDQNNSDPYWFNPNKYRITCSTISLKPDNTKNIETWSKKN